jgi:hypothetical protein
MFKGKKIIEEVCTGTIIIITTSLAIIAHLPSCIFSSKEAASSYIA